MPNDCDVFYVRARRSISSEIETQSEYRSRLLAPGDSDNIQFDYVPGYQPNATAFRAYIFSGDDAAIQRVAAREIIDGGNGTAALTDITVANYSTLTSFAGSPTFSPSTPGSGGSMEIGLYIYEVPDVQVITQWFGLLCIIQGDLTYSE